VGVAETVRTRTFVLWLAAIAAAAATAAASPAGAVTKSCGSARIEKPSGGHWICTFGDSFGGRSLNRSNWDAMRTEASNFTQGGECYVDDPQHIAVANGHLILTATSGPHPSQCGLYWTRFESGMIFTQHHFAQTYGRFKVRAKMPTGTGFQSAFWMWPEHKAYGFRSGEIDVAELFGSLADIVAPHIHLKNALGIDQGQGADCPVADPSGAFHTYVLVWLRSELRFTYDGATCMDITSWDPGAPLAFPQPFDQPFFLVLQLALGIGPNAPNANTVFPARMVVDYVRAWR